MGEPKDLHKVGKCKKCGRALYYSESEPNSEYSTVGDYDFVCYPCEFKMSDNGTWQDFKNKNLNQ